MKWRILLALTVPPFVAESSANAQRSLGDVCWSVPSWANQAIHDDPPYNRVQLSWPDVETIVSAARQLLALCTYGPAATKAQATRRDSLAELIDKAIVNRPVNHPGGAAAMVNVFSADPTKIGALAQAICNSDYVNIEPFIVKLPGGARQPPDEGYVLIQRTEGGDAAFVWRELWNGGAAIPDPGREYTVTVLGFLDDIPFRAREAVNAAALLPVPGRPGCRLIAPQLVRMKRR